MPVAQQVSLIRGRQAARARAAPTDLPQVVVAGAGFAGHTVARALLRHLRGRARIAVIDQRGHFVYLPLLPATARSVTNSRAALSSIQGRSTDLATTPQRKEEA